MPRTWNPVPCSNRGVADLEEFMRLEEVFSEIAVELFASATVEDTLLRIVALAEDAVDGCLTAGILVIDDDDRPRTVAAGDSLARTLDDDQVRLGEGPCLDAARKGVTFYALDLAADDRWPLFGPVAVGHGVRCLLAYSLSADRPGALNLYGGLPSAFGDTDRAKGQLFATLARLALNTAEFRAADQLRHDRLNDALRTRELIGQAQGILMERERIPADQAFDLLRRASQHLNVKLHEVAAKLVETGEPPSTGRESPSRPNEERPG